MNSGGTNPGRRVWLIDRWGATWEDDEVTLERFTEFYDDLDPDDHSYCVVNISDEHDWDIEFSLTAVEFGNPEKRIDEGTLVPADRAEVLAIAAEFLAGDFEALRRREWE